MVKMVASKVWKQLDLILTFPNLSKSPPHDHTPTSLCILERWGTKAAKGREIAMQDTSGAT